MTSSNRFRTKLLESLPSLLSDLRKDFVGKVVQIKHRSTHCLSHANSVVSYLKVLYSVEVPDSVYVNLEQAWEHSVLVRIKLPSEMPGEGTKAEESLFENRIFLFESRLRKMLETNLGL